MYSIKQAKWLAPNVRQLIVHAPHVVRRCKPGQFVIVSPCLTSERIPLTIAYSDREAGTIMLIIQAVGATTHKLCALDVNDKMAYVAGPLGKPTTIENSGHTVIVGGGVGTAVIYPQAFALKDKGNYVSAIMGGRTREYVILEELSAICDAVYPCTDDGSYGFHGFVTNQLLQLIEGNGRGVDEVIAAGPVPMMRAVAELTRKFNIHTIASLNPVMVDGTGMCGGCRVQIGNETKFACVDGPEFDAHQVDFDALMDRLTAYRIHEKAAMEKHQCKLQNIQEKEC